MTGKVSVKQQKRGCARRSKNLYLLGFTPQAFLILSRDWLTSADVMLSHSVQIPGPYQTVCTSTPDTANSVNYTVNNDNETATQNEHLYIRTRNAIKFQSGNLPLKLLKFYLHVSHETSLVPIQIVHQSLTLTQVTQSAFCLTRRQAYQKAVSLYRETVQSAYRISNGWHWRTQWPRDSPFTQSRDRALQMVCIYYVPKYF